MWRDRNIDLLCKYSDQGIIPPPCEEVMEGCRRAQWLKGLEAGNLPEDRGAAVVIGIINTHSGNLKFHGESST